MWTPIAFILLVAAASAEYGWKPSTQYRYEVTSRTLASLHETAHQYSGVSIKANLVIQPKDERELIARIEHAQYAQVQTPLEKGEDFKIPENELEYKSLQMSKEPVIIKLDQGVIVDLIISKEVPIWEVNIIRSIVSQLQVDTQGKNVIRSKLNMLPMQELDTALFKTMEDTVDGECETLYDITRMPKYTLQRNQHLVPQPQLIGQGQIFDVIKTKNFSNCEQRPGYHFGITGMTQWEPATNQMGNFLTRSAISRVILSGNLKSYTIQSSVTTNRIIVSPEVSNIQKGEVISRVNLTLSSVSAVNEEVQGPSNPQSVHKLVYDYNRAFIKDHEAREQLHKRQYATTESSSSSSSSSESSSASSEEWHQDLPTMHQASEYPFLPYFVGYKGHSIQEKVNTVEIAREISEKIAEEMRTPEEIPRQSTLDRFTILTNVISTMNVKQLEQLTQELYVKEESESKVYPSQRRAMWMVYRDAVAQAGTNPSLLMIKKLIENQQIQGEEAAQVVALLPETAKTPTAEYMKNFFELVKKPEVMSQTNLNTSAIFAFSNLVRMAQVHKNSMHYRYPVHAFGRLTPKQEQAVVEEYIPYMAQQLRQAVQQEDSHKIQVYIRALGNMAHPKILRVFEPYLEGEQKMTDFQRTLVIVSLNKLAKVHPRLARSVLYKTYANTGESYQVRVAAVYNLMKTNPPASMLQRMAQFTHEDPSIQVRSAVKSAIESAATLTSESNAELRQNAQSAVDMLVPEVFGIQYSRSNMTDYVVRGLNLGYTQTLNYIGSEDSLIPKALLYHLQGDVNGYRQTEYRFGGMISSVQDFRDLLEDMLTYNEQVQHQQQQREDTFNAEKVHKFLNMEHQLKDQLEGNILLQWASAQRFMTFDNHTIEAMPKQLNQLLGVLKNGKSFNYQKMYHQYSMMIGFPTSSGLPFIYSLHKPTYVWANGKVQLQLLKQEKLPLQSVQATSEIEMGFTTRRQAKISFVTPFDHTRYIAGHDRNLQVVLPVKANFDLDLQTRRVKVEIKPLNENKDYKILHVSAWPYIARHDILDFEPVSEHKNTRIIHLRQPHQIRQQFGESTGFVFRFEGKTERRFLDFKTLYEKIQQHNIVSALLYPTADETTQNNQYDLIFDDKHSSSKSMILTATYDYLDRQHQESEQKYGNMAIPSSVSIDSQSRRQEYLKRVKSGIKESTSSVVDLGVQFQGPKTVQFVATIAVASSPIDEQSNLLTYFRRVVNDEKFEICLDASSRMPFAPSDYEQATKNEPKAQVEAQLAFGERCQSGSQIVLNGKMERSQERREYLQRQPQTKQCEKEMKQESRFLSGCRNATLTANLFDKYAFTIKYDNLSKEFRNMTYQVYSVLRHLGYPHMSENPIVEGQQTNKIELDVQFRPDLTSADVFASLPNADVQFHNVRVSKYFRTLMVVHPTMNVAQRIGWSSLRQQYDAYCTIDRNQVRTFDNETYPIRIGNVWHVVLVSNPKVRVDGQYDNLHQLSVLVREDSQQQKEVQIVLYHTEETLFEFRPVADSVYGNFFVNGQRVEVSTDRVYEYRNKAQQVIVRVVVLPSGELRLVAPQHEFEFLYARVRFVINVAQVYRNRIGGLCGVFNGERYDFVTPQQYILRDPEQFAATWALSNEGRFAELKQEAQKYSDYKKVVILTNTISEQDAGRVDSRGRQHIELKSSAEDYDSSSSSSSASSSESKEYEQGSIRRIVVLERQGKHCFSLHPHTVCKNGYESKTMKTVRAKFVCVNKTQASSHWAQMVARGARPNLASKGNAQELQFPVPVKCTQL